MQVTQTISLCQLSRLDFKTRGKIKNFIQKSMIKTIITIQQTVNKTHHTNHHIFIL